MRPVPRLKHSLFAIWCKMDKTGNVLVTLTNQSLWLSKFPANDAADGEVKKKKKVKFVIIHPALWTSLHLKGLLTFLHRISLPGYGLGTGTCKTHLYMFSHQAQITDTVTFRLCFRTHSKIHLWVSLWLCRYTEMLTWRLQVLKITPIELIYLNKQILRNFKLLMSWTWYVVDEETYKYLIKKINK